MECCNKRKIIDGYLQDVNSIKEEFLKTGNEFTKQLLDITIKKVIDKINRYEELKS